MSLYPPLLACLLPSLPGVVVVGEDECLWDSTGLLVVVVVVVLVVSVTVGSVDGLWCSVLTCGLSLVVFREIFCGVVPVEADTVIWVSDTCILKTKSLVFSNVVID